MRAHLFVRPDARALGGPGPAPVITQDLFETDASQLLALLHTGAIGDPRWCGVLQNYATDVKLADAVQPDLFAAVVPFLWGAWQETLLAQRCIDATSELNSMLFKKPRVHLDALGPGAQDHVEAFARDSLLFAIASPQETGPDQSWVPFWVSLSSAWPGFAARTWDALAAGMSARHTEALFHFISRVAYPNADNPLLNAGSSLIPELWEQASFDSGLFWRGVAVSALEQRLAWDAADEILGAAVEAASPHAAKDLIELVVNDIRANRRSAYLTRRSILLKNLGRPGLDKFWDDELGAV
jgi:hypothetical protein